MKKNVKDITEQINNLFFNFDFRFLATAISNYVPQIEITFETTKAFIESTMLAQRTPGYLSEEIGQTLKELDEIDDIQLEGLPDYRKAKLQSNIGSLFKVYSTEDSLHQSKAPASLYAVLRKSMKALPLMCSRTIFLTSNSYKNLSISEHVNEDGFVDSYDFSVTSDENFIDEYKITAYYFKMVQLYFKLIEKVGSGLTYGSVNKFKALLAQKIQEIDSKLTTKNADKACDPAAVDLVISVVDSHGNITDIKTLIEKQGLSGDSIDSFNISQYVQEKDFLTVEIVISNIGLSSNVEHDYSMRVGDTFYISGAQVTNLTQNINYFDFYDSRSSLSEPIKRMKDLYASNILGSRKLHNCKELTMKLVMKEKLKNIGIIFPEFPITLTWFEKGLKVLSEKSGAFILSTDEITNAQFIRYKAKPIVVLTLKQPKFFNKFTENILLLECSGLAVTDFFYPFYDHLNSLGIPCENLNALSSSLDQSLKAFDLENWLYSKFEKFRLDNTIIKPSTDLYNIPEKASQGNEPMITVIVYEEMCAEKMNHDLAQDAKVSKLPTDSIDFKSLKSSAIEDLKSQITSKITALSTQAKGKLFIKVPLWANSLHFWKALAELTSAKIEKVVLLLEFDHFARSSFSDKIYQKFIFNMHPSLILFSSSFTAVEACDSFVYSISRIFHQELNFSQINYVKGNSLVQKIDGCSAKESSNKMHQRIRALEDQSLPKPLILADTQAFHVSMRTPVSREAFNGFLDHLFVDRKGYLLIEENPQRMLKKGKSYDLQEIEQFIKALKSRVKLWREFREGKSIKIDRISGFIRFDKELDKVFTFDVSINERKVSDLKTPLATSEVESDGLKFIKPVYKEFDALQFGMTIYASGVTSQGTLFEKITSKLTEVSS